MDKAFITSNLHLAAVLPRLEELVQLDDEARELAKQLNMSIRFWVKGGPSVILTFKDGTVKASRYPSDKVDVGLAFWSCEQLNDMFDGKKVIPVPYKGFLKLKNMKTFEKLTERLTKFLKPEPEDLKDPAFAAKYVAMSMLVGANGAGVIAKYDEKLQKVAKHLPDGTILYRVNPDGPFINVSVERGNVLARLGEIENPVSQLFWGRTKLEYATGFFTFSKGSKYQTMMHKFKYHGNKEIGYVLGKSFGNQLRNSVFNQIDVIIPVPLHKSKLKKRGYNQSEWIAKGLSESLHKPLDVKSFIRSVATETQTRKSRFERWRNVENIFKITKENNLRGKHVLLVDDVVTTGSTLEACANAILKIKDTKVSIATLAVA